MIPTYGAMNQASTIMHDEGLFPTSGPGRTDNIPTLVPGDSHVIPADIVSGLGEGNTLNGASLLDKMFDGIKQQHARSNAPRVYNPSHNVGIGQAASNLAHGGFAHGGKEHYGDRVKIIAAGGEYLVHPDTVRAIGGGDIEKGHQAIDHFILLRRKMHIEHQKKLKPPVGFKKK